MSMQGFSENRIIKLQISLLLTTLYSDRPQPVQNNNS